MLSVLRRRPGPRAASGNAPLEGMSQLRFNLHHLPASHRAGRDLCIVFPRHACCHRARLPGSKPPRGICASKGCQVGRRCRPGCHHCGLPQQEQTQHQRHDHRAQGQCEHGTGAAFVLDACLRLHGVAASARADAEAFNVQGIIGPKAPPTGEEAVTVTHSPSSVSDEATLSPASRLTIPSTEPESSPRADARAPALAASSSRSWVIPAAPPANRNARSNTTAGKATANSAVTAPLSLSCREPLPRAGSRPVMAGTTPYGSG